VASTKLRYWQTEGPATTMQIATKQNRAVRLTDARHRALCLRGDREIPPVLLVVPPSCWTSTPLISRSRLSALNPCPGLVGNSHGP
jgi:hypothetical protein